AAATEATDVRVLFTADVLYFGIVCHDRTPAAIVATQLTRDADLEVDDGILVVIDPFFDQRNGFFFEVNPAGARSDGQVSNNAEETSREWDGIWDARARITAEGWVAEIAIPFKTLRFKPGQTTWGLNVERRIKRNNETDRWAAARQDVWVSNLVEAGRLEGLSGIRQGSGLDIKPYALAGEENSDGTFQAGFDVFKNLTSNLNASLTVNTDFAETEVDERQINLTRFPLFFPEKRAFFLEGGGVFDLAGTGGFHQDLVPFFTRRIGLLEGEQVPIAVGAKLIGRASNYNIGLLDVRTRDTADNPRAGQNLLAARVSRNVFQQSWVGGIVTRGNPAGTGSNTLLGVDTRLATSSFSGDKNLLLDLFFLRTDDGERHAADYAFGGALDYPNDLWDLNLSAKQIGADFNPALGFVPRTGIRKTSGRASFQPRPVRSFIRQFFFEVEAEWVGDLNNRVQNWTADASPMNFETNSGEKFQLDLSREFEYLPESFEISDGVVVPMASYGWTRYGVEAETANKRWWVVSAEAGWGGFYDGTRRDLQVSLTFKPSTHVAVALTAERNDVSLPAGEFFTTIASGNISYNFSPNVSWANLVQYDSESRELGLQSRFRWIVKPGTDLFVVFNRGWYRDFRGAYLPTFDRGSVKFQYTFRL
ncbi:MAG: carbohydrate binding family 9 domain-containing protein, partial [Acidobacteria bacterium]|nr:carbohydrate binding family 9 domain-containing protein [Acidobacteriota bacterium]